MRRILLASALLFALAVSAAAGSVTKTKSTTHRAALAYLAHEVRAYENATWRWQRLTGAVLSQTAGRVLASMSVADAKRALRLWERRAKVAYLVARHPPHLQDWLCIHRYEGAWADTGGPYWGGLQMSLEFQQSYGPELYRTKGTADHWSPLEQMWVAERALKVRGFYPWPNTARICGLL